VLPVGAADFVAREELPGPLLNHFDNGGYLLYRLYPRARVFISGDTSMYPPEFFREFHRRVLGAEADLAWSVERYGVRVAVLSHASPETALLAGKLASSPSWALVFLDEAAAVFVRSGDDTRALVERARVDLDRWQDSAASRPIDVSPMPRWSLPRSRVYPALNLARFLRGVGRPDLALEEADRLWRAGPDMGLAVFTAAVAEEAGELPRTVPQLEWALERRAGDPTLRSRLARAVYSRALRSLDQGRMTDGRADLERALVLVPAEPGPRVALARIDAAQGDLVSARRSLAAALALEDGPRIRAVVSADPLLSPLLTPGPKQTE
jgi:hypothetical protein